ncbi:MAG: GerMN domain-containing protein [Sporomusaceae bacterium]|nr:GerMN domain-containing protein [Sporomusaceae bacterium]
MVSRRILLAMIFILVAALIGGCTENQLQPQQAANESVKNDKQQTSIPGNQSSPSSLVPQEKMVVTVYNATKDAMHLVAEVHIIDKNDHPAKSAIELLLAGTQNVDLLSIIPTGTQLRHISVKDNIAYVDFNDKLIKNNTGGSASEILLVAAIVNTLTEFHNIQKVQIMVEGKKIDTISGHMDTSEPLSRSEKIIKK